MDRISSYSNQIKRNSVLISIALIICLTPNLIFSQDSQVIYTGAGPEDMVLDTSNVYPRLLISNSARRPEMGKYGEIEEYNLKSGKHRILPRIGEPEDLEFYPHGIYQIKINGTSYLYAISHYSNNEEHPVIRYILEKDRLLFDKAFPDPLLVSPNALTVFDNGSFLVCNDASKRDSKIAQILGLKTGNLIYFNQEGRAKIVAKRLGMPAGMNQINNKIYLSCATENKLYSFDFDEGLVNNKKLLSRIKGPDNIRISEAGLWIACHLKTMAFVKHISDGSSPSPSTVFLINPETGEKRIVFQDNGELISAGSVALPYSGNIFIGQIFESFIVKTRILDL